MLINPPLFKAMLKQQQNTMLKITAGIILYEELLAWVYPAIAKTPAVTEIVDAFPSAVKTVFGVSPNARTDTFEAYISSQFFARIWTMLMAFYGINTANALLSKLVEDGSLVLPLSTPVSRSTILTTQAAVLFVNNAVIITLTFWGLYFGTTVFGIYIEKTNYRKLFNLSLAFFSLISSYAFFFATLAEREKSLAYAYGLTFAFYVLDVLAGLSDKLSGLGRLSLFRLLKPQEVLEGTINPTGIIVGLSLAAGFIISLAMIIFDKKDLPL